jgi:tRNA pseudouridine55 synthase
MATGMLPICLEEATKVIAEIEVGTKCYEFTVQLGIRTDTGDAEGSAVEQAALPPVDAARVESALGSFRGVQQQVPPMYSALKRAGQPLYELARQGIEVERPARTIEIRRLELLGLRDGALELVCECAKGTYIRVLGEDIARKLGTVGHLTRLRRAWVTPFREMPMFTLEAVLAGAEDASGLRPMLHFRRCPTRASLRCRLRRYSRGRPLHMGWHRSAARGSTDCGTFMGLAEGLPDGDAATTIAQQINLGLCFESFSVESAPAKCSLLI